MSHVQQVKQVLNQAAARLKKFRALVGNTDDSVEAQAETLRRWMWSSAVGLSLIVVATVVARGSDDGRDTKSTASEVAMADQLPPGFVLVPIEPTNLDSLDSIFGQYGYADLYRAAASDQKGHRLARGIRLVRSPRDPRRFAALIPESDSARLSDLAEPVLVILRKGPAQQIEAEHPKAVEVKRVRRVRKTDLVIEGEPESISLNTTGEINEN